MINYTWISKLLRDAAFAWRPSWLKSDLFRDLLREIWLPEQFLYYKKVLFWCFWVSREINSRFCSKTQWQMFLLVSGRHVGVHPDGLQHGGPVQISINLGKKFFRISCIRKIAMTWNLARVFVYSPSFFSQNLDFIYWMVLIFILNGVTLKTSNRDWTRAGKKRVQDNLHAHAQKAAIFSPQIEGKTLFGSTFQIRLVARFSE